MDENGIHYIVLHGIIETDPSIDAFATITIKKDQLIVDGKGTEQSLVLPITLKATEMNQVNNESASDDLSENSETTGVEFKEYNDEQLPATASAVVEVSV